MVHLPFSIHSSRLEAGAGANDQVSIANAMSAYQLDFIGSDEVSQLQIDERKSKYAELAAFMNAEPDEIGTL
jgi:hypothetical protein